MLHDGSALVADFGIALAVSQRGRRLPDDRDRHVARHAALHVARAGDGRAGDHRAERHLRAGLRALRDADRRAAVRGRHGAGDRGAGADRVAPLAQAAAEEHPAAGRGGGAHRAGEAAGGSLRERQGVRRGAGRSGLCRRARTGDTGDPVACGSGRGEPPDGGGPWWRWPSPSCRPSRGSRRDGRVAPAATGVPADRAALRHGAAGQRGADRRPRHANWPMRPMARSSPIPRVPA